MRKVKLLIPDTAFADYIKARDRVCQKCGGGVIEPGKLWARHLNCAHFHGRGKYFTRWDEDNACGLCFAHHSYLDANPIEKCEFFKNLLGAERYEALNKRALKLGAPDRVEITKIFKKKLEELNGT